MRPKLISTMIIIVIATGTAIIPLVGRASIGTEPLKDVFFAFVSAIIAVQLVPAVMLLWGFLKTAFAGSRKTGELRLS